VPELVGFRTVLMAEAIQVEQDEEVFDYENWLETTSLSAGGRTKLAKAEITDLKSLLLVLSADILALKLASGDRAKFSKSIGLLRAKEKASEEIQPSSADSTPPVSSAGVLPVSDSSGASVTLPPPSDFSNAGNTQKFGIAEVAAFLVGRTLPPNLQTAVAG
jgi:hypothetical protein